MTHTPISFVTFAAALDGVMPPPAPPRERPGRTPTVPMPSNDNEGDLEKSRSALRHCIDEKDLDLSRYDHWIGSGMALKATHGEAGFSVWHALSSQAGGYAGEADCLAKWATFKAPAAGNPKTMASYFALAIESGWTFDSSRDESRLLTFQPGYSRVDPKVAKSALAHLDPSSARTRKRVGEVLFHCFAEGGLLMFEEWVKGSGHADTAEGQALWERLGERKHHNAPSLAYLIRKARKAARAAGQEYEPDCTGYARACIEELNRDHAVVTRGGKTVVLWEHFDPVMGRFVVTYLTKRDFIDKHVRPIELPPGESQKRGKGNTLSLGNSWFNSPLRRSFEGVYFAPGKILAPNQLNLWRGFAVDPIYDAPERWSRLRQHIFDHIAGGDQAHFDYIMNWLAHVVQKLGIPVGTALVLLGEKGHGKSILIQLFGYLFGAHTFVTANECDITGRFNGHLETVILFGIEEAVAPQNRKADGMIKDLITRRQLRLEDKFFSPWTAPNNLNIIMTSNNDHVVRASGYERRYATFDVTLPYTDDPDKRRAYFVAIIEQMQHGGYAAMLGDLLRRDISAWNPEALPRTAALHRQAQHTLIQDPVKAWYFERLAEGISITGSVIFAGRGNLWSKTRIVEVRVRDALDDYRSFCEAHRVPYSERQLALRLPPLMPDGFKSVVRKVKRSSESRNDYGHNVYKAYPFPPLPEARAAFTKKTGLTFDD